ncbi:hypothetical protein EVAR_63136_1 [Eumeta japonica]|uniref:Uncharacterized protein n=1 Tax=Eumeta variegata TaxID=151549 RepID=A0A4C2AAS2_EUMVA|nr:hypothetical protein EVAR_63136_1 [Eumeta japonica]
MAALFSGVQRQDPSSEHSRRIISISQPRLQAFNLQLAQFCVTNGVMNDNDKIQLRTVLTMSLDKDTIHAATSLVALDSLDAVLYTQSVAATSGCAVFSVPA